MKGKIYVNLAVIAALIMVGETAGIVTAQSESPESMVSIEFEEGDANVSPVDPENPEIPGNGGTGESGSLALNHVSNFYFKKEELSTLYAEYPSETIKPFIQVTDARGTGEGWKVSARASRFKTELGKESLFGSTMTLTDGNCIPYPPDMLLPPPQPVDPVTLEFSNSDLVKIVSAEKDMDMGMGTWLTRWYTNPNAEENYSVMLKIPAGTAMKGSNTATITWILSSGPA